jgi:hypothetical protein
VASDRAGADWAAGAEFEQAVMNAAVPRTETSSAAVRRFRLQGVRREAACPRTGSVPGGR